MGFDLPVYRCNCAYCKKGSQCLLIDIDWHDTQFICFDCIKTIMKKHK